MVNPLAFMVIALGVFLALLGAFLAVKRKKRLGAFVAVVGLCAIAIPFFVSFYLA